MMDEGVEGCRGREQVRSRVPLKDRREFPRYPADLRLEVRRERSPAPGLRAGAFPARCVDLSRAGARFLTRELFHRRETLTLVFFNSSNDPELCCEIEVVRSTRVSRQYEVAGKVTKMLAVDELDASGGHSADDTFA